MLVLLTFCALVVFISTEDKIEACQQLETGFPGADINEPGSKTANFRECVEACRALEGCVALTFRSGSSACFLKDRKNGKNGPISPETSTSLNMDCLAVNGGFSGWGSWDACSATCGGGTQTQTRTCTNPAPADGGEDCDGEKSQSQACNKKNCPVNGGYSGWGSWGTCSKTCGGGTKYQYRTCTNPAPADGGEDCDGEKSQSQACNQQNCPELKVYEHGDLGGDSTTYTGYVNNVGNSWNDEVSSVSAIGGDWILFDDTSYSGTSWCVKEGQKVNVPKKFNDKITSLKPVTSDNFANLYHDNNRGGKVTCTLGAVSNSGSGMDFNDKIDYIEVLRGQFRFYKDTAYRGKSFVSSPDSNFGNQVANHDMDDEISSWKPEA